MRLADKKRRLSEAVTREALYEAAVRILNEEGWKGFTMEKLAQMAGVAKGTVYNYFQGKGDVLFFVMDRNGRFIAEKMTQICEDVCHGKLSPEAGLNKALTEAAYGMYQQRHVIAAIARAFEEDPALMERKRRLCGDKERHPLEIIRRCIREIIARGVEEGSFMAVSPQMAETVIHCAIMGLGRLFALEEIPAEEGTDRIGKLLSSMFLWGLKARTCGEEGVRQ